MAKKKKKIERGYATISTSKKEPIAANVNDESIQELEIPTRNDESMAVPDNDIDQTKDADRLLKWQVDYDYKLYDQKRVKLEANDAVPYFQVINETEALELLSGLEEDAQMGSSDEMNKTFLMMDKLGFDRDIIKACLRNSAGDLNSAIGWAYLNYQSLDLPVWLSRENVKIVAAGESDGDVDRVIGANETKNDLKSDFRIHEADNTKLPVAKETLKGGVDKDMQQRILASLEWMDSDNDDVEVQDKEQEKTKDVDDYATMYIQYLKFKNTAASAKVKGDNLLKKSASNSAHKLMQKIIQVKSKMDLDQLKRAEDMIDAWVVKDAAVNKNDCVAEAEDSLQDDELGLDILEKSAEEANNSESKTIFIHDLSWKGWSGSSPSFWLSDFIRRNFPKSKISISLFPKTVAYRAKLSLISDGESKEYIMAEDELVMAKSDAKEYIALKTLFFLSPEAQIRNSVAPPFRDLWANWCEEAARALKQESDTLDEDRISFIESLLVNEPKKPLRNAIALDENTKSRMRTKDLKAVSGLKDRSRLDNSIFKRYLIDRSRLPIYSSRQEIIDQIRENQVVIISGETGSGKSTQIPQFIMEDAIERSDESFLQLYCCEPRRISAISLATRVSIECGDGTNQVGKSGSWIGYKVRMDNRTSSSTLVTFCTLGILLRMLVGDPNLSNISHVVVDEVHERSLESDFLLLLLKRLILVRSDLKIILMSATADTQKYLNYFRPDFDPVYLHIPGTVFPVKEFYLEDIVEQIGWEPDILENINFGAKSSKKINITGKRGKQVTVHAEWSVDDELDMKEESKDMDAKMRDLQLRNRKIDMEFLEALIIYVVKYSLENSLGAILVFLPGVAEINALQDRLDALSSGRSPLPCITFPLYSDLPNAEQLKVFDRVSEGFVKVVLSTNIAETGLTVPDITFVIDTAKARELSYDPTLNLTVLREIVVSKSNCLQRRGRAGRTRAGIYYNILPKSAFDSLPDHRPPELMRLPLEGICLKARAILGHESGSLKSLFAETIDPPPAKNIEKAVTLLQQLQAITKSEELTPLGVHLSKLGLDVKLGKMLIYAVIFRCLDPILTISACLRYFPKLNISIGKSIFVTPFGDNTDYKRALKKFYAADSDLLMIYNAYLKWKNLKSQNPSKAAVNAYCKENYMNVSVLSSLDSAKSQIIKSLLDTGILDRKQKIYFGESLYDLNSLSHNITKTVLSIAFFPNIVQARKHSDRFGISLYRIGDGRPVNIHQNSFLCDNISSDSWYGSNFMKASNRKIIALDLNRISPIGMFCLVTSDIEINLLQHSFTVFDGLITIKALPKALILVSKLSKLIQKAVNCYLQAKSSLTKDSADRIIQKFSNIL